MQKLYKTQNGDVFAYSSEEEKVKYSSVQLTKLTDSEAADYQESRKPLKVAELKELIWRESQLKIADCELNKVQDADPKAVGTVAEWRTYRKELRAWPENTNFPTQNTDPQHQIVRSNKWHNNKVPF